MADYFVDFSAGSHGTGTFASPYNTLVHTSSYTLCNSSDTVWVRRNRTSTWSTGKIAPNILKAGKIVGWPTATDPYYSIRPSSAQATWDPDPAVNPKIVKTTTVTGEYLVVLDDGGIVELCNIDGSINTNIAGPNAAIIASTAVDTKVVILTNCAFTSRVEQAGVRSGSLFLCTNGGTADIYIDARVNNCSWHFKNEGGTLSAAGFTTSAMSYQDAANGRGGLSGSTRFVNCTFKMDYPVAFQAETGGSPINSVRGTFIRCTMEWTVHITTNAAGCIAPSIAVLYAAPAHLIDCTFKSVYAGTVDQNILLITSAPQQNDLSRFTVRGLKVIGFNEINVDRLGEVHIADATVDTIRLRGGGIYTLDNVNATTLRVNKDNQGLTASPQICTAFLKNYNAGLAITRNLASVVFATGANNAPSSWNKLDSHGTVSAATPYRAGGEGFSMKLLAAIPYVAFSPGIMSNVRGLETIFASCGSGARTVTIFGYHKAFAPQVPDTENIFAEVEYRGASSTSIETSRANVVGTSLTSDASTWTGVSGGTPFKIVLSFTAAGNQAVAIRIGTTLSQAAGELYIDPKPVVT
jgi:hypothetical protein